MSAATRRPYLGETVHVAQEAGEGIRCLAAFVSNTSQGDAAELWVLKQPAPAYVWMRYDPDHRNGSWHYAH